MGSPTPQPSPRYPRFQMVAATKSRAINHLTFIPDAPVKTNTTGMIGSGIGT